MSRQIKKIRKIIRKNREDILILIGVGIPSAVFISLLTILLNRLIEY